MMQLLSRQDCLSRYGSDYYIRQRVANGTLYQIERGVFSEHQQVPDAALLCWKYPNAVITMLSAFYHYGLTDVIPDKCDLTTDNNAAKIRDSRVRQHYLAGDFLYVGAVFDEESNYPIRIYNRERMLIELLRNKNILPFDLYKEVLLNYRRIIPQMDMQAIQDYAMQSPKRAMVMDALQMEVL